MNKRTQIIAGNWKMNLDFATASSLADAILNGTSDNSPVRIVLAPQFPMLYSLELQTKLRTNIFIAAQNCSAFRSGAYTGEVSASFLGSIGVEAVIIGHSERRTLFSESNRSLAEKVDRCIESNLQPIFCCGESLKQREAGIEKEVVKEQLHEGLFHLSVNAFINCIIAYEPVWAIGTGVTATPEQAQQMHEFIRSCIEEKFGKETAGTIRLLYGGSVNAANASALFACPDIDGALVGGASLKANEFLEIIQAAESSA